MSTAPFSTRKRTPGRSAVLPTGSQAGRIEPRVRRGVLRLPGEVAWRLRAGHPFVYRDTFGQRPMRDVPGEIIDLTGPEGEFVARGYYDPEGPIAVRVLSRDEREPLDALAFLNRVQAARRLRDSFLPLQAEGALSAYRVLNSEGDFLPGITVDRYEDYLVAHVYTPAIEPYLPLIYDALMAVWQPRGLYAQRRFRPLHGEGQRAPAELVRGSAAPVEIVVTESGLRFASDVTAPLSTGLFLDLRAGRQRTLALARGRRVLNLFSYTGAFSVYAARGGAKGVTSVDLSAKAHARTRKNLALNDMPEAGHEFITGDVRAVLARLADRKRSFDAVIVDPPSFSQTRGGAFAVQRDYASLLADALAVCAPGALLLCSANSAKYSLDELETAVGEGAGHAGRHVRIMERTGLPVDFPVPAGFPEGHYLKFLTCMVV